MSVENNLVYATYIGMAERVFGSSESIRYILSVLSSVFKEFQYSICKKQFDGSYILVSSCQY